MKSGEKGHHIGNKGISLASHSSKGDPLLPLIRVHYYKWARCTRLFLSDNSEENSDERPADRPAVSTLLKDLYLQDYASDLHAVFAEW